MARTIRIQYPGAVYHIYSRGIEKRDIFRDNADRQKFIDVLTSVKKKIKFEIYAYALMPNHYHIMLMTPEANLGKIMHRINTAYTVYFNWKYKRIGHFYQDRYKSIIVNNDEYFLDLTRYIHLNPVAKKSQHIKLSRYKWSSLQDYTGAGKAGISSPGRALKMFSDKEHIARKRYIAFMAEGGRINESYIKQSMFSNFIIGSETFSKEVYDYLKKKNANVPERILRVDKGSPEEIIQEVCNELKTSREEIMKKKGKSNYARKAAICLLWRNTSRTCGEIASILDTHHSNISRTLKSAGIELTKNSAFASIISNIETRLP